MSASSKPRVGGARPGFRAQLFVAFAAVATVPLLVLATWRAEIGWKIRYQLASERLAGGATAAALSVDADLRQLLKVLSNLAAQIDGATTGDAAERDRLLAVQHRSFPDFLTLVAVDRAGRVVSGHPASGADGRPIAGYDVSDREYVRRPLATGEPYVSDLLRGRGFGSHLILAMSVPRRARDGSVDGVVEGSLDIGRYRVFLEALSAIPEGEALVVDGEGRVVTQLGGSLQPMDDAGVSPVAPGATRISVERVGGVRLLTAVAAARVAPWSVVVRQPLRQIERQRWLDYGATGVWALLTLGLSLVLAWVGARRAAEPLLASERRFRELIEDSLGYFCVHDLDGGIVQINDAGAAVFGLPAAKAVGRNLREILDPRVRAGLDDYLRRIRAEKVVEGLMLIVNAKRESRTWMYRNRLIERADGQQVVVANAIDVTERERRAEELAAALTHELNQPLTAIGTSVAALRRFLARGRASSADITGILDEVAVQGERAAELARRIRTLLVPRRTAGPPCQVQEVLDQALLLVGRQLAARLVRVDVLLEPGLPAVAGERFQLTEVLVNLLLNAGEALAGWQGERKVSVLARRGGKGVQIQVSDTGPGISAALADRLFEPFVTSKPGGLGMGLAICRAIVQGAGGTIELVATPAGATFVIDLPVAA